MSRSLIATLLVIGLAAPFAALGHDPSKHKGKATKGEVVSAAAGRLELKTAAGPRTVLLDEKTKVERGDHAATQADIKKGDTVTIFGTTLASGELVAREVLLPVTAAKAKTRRKP